MRCVGDREARHHCSLASGGFPVVLALEVSTSWWPANGSVGNTPADPRDEHRQPAVGSPTDPWRVAQTWHRYRADQRGQVYGQTKRLTVPRVEDIPPQSCRWDRRDGSFRRADCLVSVALWPTNHRAWSTTDSMVWRYIAPERRMDRNRSRKHAAGNRLPAI